METDRRKNAALAINAILRGLEFDQLTFRYDATACPEVGYVTRGRGSAASGSRPVSIGNSLRELPPLGRTTSAA